MSPVLHFAADRTESDTMAEDPDPSEYLIVSLEQKRQDQTKPYDGKKMVWVPDEKECFLLGNITSTKGDMVTVDVGKGEEVRSGPSGRQLSLALSLSRIILLELASEMLTNADHLTDWLTPGQPLSGR